MGPRLLWTWRHRQPGFDWVLGGHTQVLALLLCAAAAPASTAAVGDGGQVQGNVSELQAIIVAQRLELAQLKRKAKGSTTAAVASSTTAVEQHSKGWSTVLVHVGEATFGDQYGASFSQEGQELLILALLGCPQHGFFFDMAAHTALRLSNTRLLERDWGWEGICVDANHQYWPELAHRRCRTVGAVVTDEVDSIFAFNTDKGATGHIDGKMTPTQEQAFWSDHSKSHDGIVRRSTTMTALFAQIDIPKVIDFLSLDVEGAEAMIMSAFPFDSHTIKVMTVERPTPELKSLLQRHGYVQLGVFGIEGNNHFFGESLWAHASLEGGVARATAMLEEFNSIYEHIRNGNSHEVSALDLAKRTALHPRWVEGATCSVSEGHINKLIHWKFAPGPAPPAPPPAPKASGLPCSSVTETPLRNPVAQAPKSIIAMTVVAALVVAFFRKQLRC